MKQTLVLAFLLLGACRDQRPPSPTAEQNQQLNEADSMLNEMANEEGAEDRSPAPSDTRY